MFKNSTTVLALTELTSLGNQ